MTDTAQSYRVTDVTGGPAKHATFRLCNLLSAANSLLNRTEATLTTELSRQRQAVSEAVREKAGLVDGYWKPAHVARLRYEAAKGLYEALQEITADGDHEGLGK